MNRKGKNEKMKKRLLSLARYSAKRHTPKWKKRKKMKQFVIQKEKQRKRKQVKKPFTPLSAPKLFSLISNTNEVLEYFETAEHKMRHGENIIFDIANVDTLTPDTIALLVASINDSDFTHKSNYAGNAPVKTNLLKLFTESGFYDHVNAKGFFSSSKENLLHKEVHHKVEPKIAKKASLVGIKHVFDSDKPYEPLYEILIECMSNTNNHADPEIKSKCNWWLYVYNEPNKKITSYSFLDLGVGIFESAVVKNYLKKLFKGTSLYKNINLVDDLLAGKIQSRIDLDNDIRGKGIPQIVEHSNSDHFESFYIITNDVKINLKDKSREQLKFNLNGTFLYWELKNKRD